MDSPRLRLPLNRDWRFLFGDELAARWPEVSVEDWYEVELPHSFGIPAGLETDFYVGFGSYRRNLDIPASWTGRRVALEFHGVFQHTEVYCNGLLAGSHAGGYSAFEVDLTPYLTAGRNVVFVRVDNRWDARLAPRAGEHVFNGGVYRDVELIVTDMARIDRHGVTLTTPQVSSAEAMVHADVRIRNDTRHDIECSVSTLLLLAGEQVASAIGTATVPARGIATAHAALVVADPELWSPDSPALYTAYTAVRTAHDGALIDEVRTSFGIRTLEFTADRGFYLNGEHLLLNGVNAHQDRAGWGDAGTRASIRRDIALIKEAGFNFVRGSHYPHHEAFAEECDRQGLLFWSEAPFWGMGGENIEGYWTASAYPPDVADQPAFEESCLAAMTEMIDANRNHPSVIVWSTGNEVFFSDDEVVAAAKALTQRMIDLAHDSDPTRPVAVGGAQRKGFDQFGDVVGYNGDGATLYQHPERPNIVSEYGSIIADRPGAFAPSYADDVQYPRAWRSGIALWCVFHHASIAPGMGRMGIVDHHRIPLRAWYWYRQEQTGVRAPNRPVASTASRLEISSDTNSIGIDGLDDARIVLTATDAEGRVVEATLEIQLEVVSGGAEFPAGRHHRLSPNNGSFVDGIGAIELRAYAAGPIVVHARAPGLPSAELVITAHGDERWDGTFRRKPAGPPSRLVGPRSTGAMPISRSRPVFASSTAPGHSAAAVTALDDGTWAAAPDDPAPELVVDLEGPHPIRRIMVRFSTTGTISDLATSEDGIHYRPAAAHHSDDAATFDADGRLARFVRARPRHPRTEIAAIEVFE
ncbi:MAG: glycoside hydrolase family 2 TIM barrel-domain containing protein [Rhodococcus sp. (in: high G+C Gram-positive bacteria)]